MSCISTTPALLYAPFSSFSQRCLFLFFRPPLLPYLKRSRVTSTLELTMSSRNAHAHDGDSSRKGRLSFLLNHDDEDKRLHEINSNSHDERSAPSGDGEWGGPGFFHSSFAANRGHGMDSGMISLPSGSTFQGRTPQYDRANSSKANSASESGGSEKKGVRKKRQRKFICDRCSFGFYTNSDLQKVR